MKRETRIRLRIEGPYACFTRPEMRGDRVSYDVITPSAARGIIEAIYWNPAIRWVVDRLHVLKPVRFTNIRRNEIRSVISIRNFSVAMSKGIPIEVFVEKDRIQRDSMILRDVCYVIEAHCRAADRGEKQVPCKYKKIFDRRLSRGQCFRQPFLGCREFSASFKPVSGNVPISEIKGTHDLGWMLHDIDYANGIRPKFFHAVMKDGIMDVPADPFSGGNDDFAKAC